MTRLSVELLTGSYRAASRHRRDLPEWPPHPDRLFMALVASLHAGSERGPGRTRAARAALQHLESMSPPRIRASRDVAVRSAGVSHVPTNDDRITTRCDRVAALADSTLLQQLRVIPERRGRRPRFSPCVTPPDPCVSFEWDETLATSELEALRMLGRDVSYLGCSASLVRISVKTGAGPANLVPVEGRGDLRLRVPLPGRLATLESSYKCAPDQVPPVGGTHAYRWLSEPPRSARLPLRATLLPLVQAGGDRLRLPDTLSLANAFRRTVLSGFQGRPVPQWISGHEADGRPDRSDHMGFLPLTRRGADGALVVFGVAVAVPNWVENEDMMGELAATLRFVEIRGDGFEGTFSIAHSSSGPLEQCLNAIGGGRYGSRRWASVTPVVFDRHAKRGAQVEDQIRLCCRNAGLPDPATVQLCRRPLVLGAVDSDRMPSLVRSNGRSGRRVHVVIEFDSPIRGPVRLGAGRFLGYGLCHRLGSGSLTPAPSVAASRRHASARWPMSP